MPALPPGLAPDVKGKPGREESVQGPAKNGVAFRGRGHFGQALEDLAGPPSNARSRNLTWQKRKRKQMRGQREGRAGVCLGEGYCRESLQGGALGGRGIGSRSGSAVTGVGGTQALRAPSVEARGED